MATYYTDFSEYTTGVAPSDWTRRWLASNITDTVVEDVGVTGGKLLRISNNIHVERLLSWDDLDADVDRDDVEIAFKWRATTPSNGKFTIGAGVRASGSFDDETGYNLSAFVDTGDDHVIRKNVNGTPTELDSQSRSFLEDTWYWTRARVIGTSLLAHTWLDGDTEPGSFDNLVPLNFGSWGSGGGAPTLTAGQSDPFGGTDAFLVEDANTGDTELLSQPVSFTGDGDKGFGIFIKEGTLSAGGTQIIQIRDNSTGTNHHIEFTWSGGAPSISSSPNVVVLDTVAYPDGWYHMKLQATGIVAANDNRFRILPASSGAAETGSLFIFRPGAYDDTTPDPIWDLAAEDSSITAAGWVGLFGHLASTVDVDVFAAGTGGDSAPAPVTAGGGQEARTITEGIQLGYSLGFAATLPFPDGEIVLGDTFDARTPAGIQEDLTEGLLLGDSFSPLILSPSSGLLSAGIVLGDSFQLQVTSPFTFEAVVETDMYITLAVEDDLEL